MTQKAVRRSTLNRLTDIEKKIDENDKATLMIAKEVKKWKDKVEAVEGDIVGIIHWFRLPWWKRPFVRFK